MSSTGDSPTISLPLRITKVIFHNDLSGYTIAAGKVVGSEESATATGNLGTVSRGQVVELSGQWIETPKYGRQFKVAGSDRHRSPLGAQLAALAKAAGLAPGTQHALAALQDWLSSQALLNPYCLVGHTFFDWAIIDTLGQQVGVQADSVLRIEGCLHYLLGRLPGPCRDAGVATSDCHLPASLALAQASQLLGLKPAQIVEVLDQHQPDTIACLEHASRPIIMASKLSQAEDTIVRRVREMRALRVNLGIHTATDELSSEQVAALRGCLGQGISILSGPPGVGKTRTIASMVACLHEAGQDVAVAAYTGKAADRLNQAIGGKISSTIHRLLECAPNGGNGFYFKKNANNPLPFDVVIIDESSMLDVALLADLMAAMKLGARLILVGDENQIPPISPGQPFADLITSKAVPIFRLEQIFRQAAGSAIAEACKIVLAGDAGTFFAYLRTLEAAGEIAWKPTSSDEEIEAAIRGLLASNTGLPQILAPMRQKAGGTLSLNQMTKAVCNPPGNHERVKLADGLMATEGDSVMWIRNDYERKVFNGDSFVLGKHVKGKLVLHNVLSKTDMLLHPKDAARYLVMSYACTVHKSQGSEFPDVVLAIPGAASGFLSRALLYTALSRAKSRLWLIGSVAAIRRAIESSQKIQVRTRLLGLLESTEPAQ